MKKYSLLFLSLSFILASCNGNKSEDPGTKSYVIEGAFLTKSIEISDSKGNTTGVYNFGYDEYNRLTSLKKTMGTSDVICNLAFAYTGSTEVSLSGSYKISYSSNDTEGTVTSKGTNGTQVYNYSGKVLSNSNQSVETKTTSGMLNYTFTSSYSYASGNLTKISFSSKSSDKRTQTASFSTAGDFVKKVDYSSTPDKQNFSALVLSDNFPLWYVKGFPGNAMLPESISVDDQNAGVTKSEFAYTMNPDGFITSVVRTDYKKSTKIQTLTYKFTY